jgi:acyl-CoA dehydrogenase
MYGLTAEDRRVRDTARAFVESLMPHEVEAEIADGVLPKELTAEHQARAIELGLYATNMPASVGGPRCTALQQVLARQMMTRGPAALLDPG